MSLLSGCCYRTVEASLVLDLSRSPCLPLNPGSRSLTLQVEHAPTFRMRQLFAAPTKRTAPQKDPAFLRVCKPVEGGSKGPLRRRYAGGPDQRSGIWSIGEWQDAEAAWEC